MKFILLITLLSLNMTVSADSYDDDLKELFELTGVKNNYVGLNNIILNQMQVSFFQSAEQNIDGNSLSEEQKQQVGEILKTRFSEMVKAYQSYISEKMSYDQVEKEVYLPLYKETYTQEEVKELITFYSSPVGKKTIEFSREISDKAAKKSAEKYDSIIADFVKQKIDENIELAKKEISDKGIN